MVEQETMRGDRAEVALACAERAACERLVNAYLRESGQPDPRVSALCLLSAGVPPDVVGEVFAEGQGVQVALPAGGGSLVGSVCYFSAAGHHQYGQAWWYVRDGVCAPVEGARALAALLASELAAPIPDPALRAAREQELLAQIANSVEKTARYVGQRLQRASPRLAIGAADRMLAAEQSLLLGHPFHPTPKSSEGFSHADLGRFAPELGASFRLHYFAVAPELVHEDPPPEDVIPLDVRRAAARHPDTARPGWRLLPCHPWQAAHLAQLPLVRDLIAQGRLAPLGPLGAPVYPTSSVRTVLLPEQRSFFKLPLDVRITHFVRNNPLDHLRRSLDVSRVVARLQARWPYAGCTILRELGYRTVLPPGAAGPEQSGMAASFAVLFRAGPPPEADDPMVLAALLEPDPLDDLPPIARAVRQAAGTHRPTAAPVAAWLRRYLELMLVPVVRLFLDHGLSLEAHVQNTLVTLAEGWPAHVYIRDLEGACVSRERCAALGYADLLAAGSPALSDDAECWHRLQYYVLVNQLGQLVFTLARYVGGDERGLWQVVRELLRQLVHSPDPRLERLLAAPTLPAKANLLSRFHQRGETPLYVPIPNLLAHQENT